MPIAPIADTSVAWIGVALTCIGATVAAAIYMSRLIDLKLSTIDFDRKFEALEHRVRKLELWAASQGRPGPSMTNDR
jgi:hypothetical protein